ncbi:MAG: signal peptide peptidase SppA [Candidatus Hydrothermota bacterium]|nr:MAG: signal peptide peptidase SppA [Candidatus Hydrothermae bacterium]
MRISNYQKLVGFSVLLAIVAISGFTTALTRVSIPSFGFGSKKIGYVKIEGAIADPQPIVAWLEQLREDDDVAAVIVRINSPGGSVAAAYEILNALKRIQARGKPVVVSMGNVAASGGYYIACHADKIVATPGTLTGSIGVIMELPDVSELMDKVGIRVNVIKSSNYKDIGSPFRPMNPDERRLLKDIVDEVYNDFVDLVAEGRNLPRDSVEKIADGRILTGKQAYEYGLVDTLGDFLTAYNIAKSLANLRGKPPLKRPKRRRVTLLDLLLHEVRTWMTVWPKLEYRVALDEVGS